MRRAPAPGHGPAGLAGGPQPVMLDVPGGGGVLTSGCRVRLVVVVLLLVLAAGTGCASPPGPSAAPEPAPPAPTAAAGTSSGAAVRPVGVPLSVEGARLVATVEIGGASLRVIVDTGSSGLRVPASEVPPGAAVVRGPAKPITFVSGERLTGTTAQAPLRIGGVPSAGPVPIELVTGTGCAPGHPGCAAAGGRTPGIMGGRFDGIIGINALSADDVPNPLWYLGAVGHTYTVHVDPSGGSTLVLGDPADGFALQRLRQRAPGTAGGTGPPAWDPHYDLCAITDRVPGGRLCATGGLDTGNPSLADLHRPGGPDLTFPPGTPITLSTGDGHWSAAYVTGPGRSVSLAPTRRASDGWVGLGLPALSGSDLRIDLDTGTVGLRRR